MSNEEWHDLPTMQDVARAQYEGWEIEVFSEFYKTWVPWNGENWSVGATYHGRPKQPKKRKIKLLAWYNGSLNWYSEDDVLPSDDWYRVPSEDKTVEVEQ